MLSRWRLLPLVALALGATAVACRDAEEEPVSGSSANLTQIEPTPAKRQSIGNCWLYATAAWAESLHMEATQEELDLSEAYWTYWHWFDAITGGPVTQGSENVNEYGLVTGGFWGYAAEIISRYGWAREGEFLPGDARSIRSQRQADALVAINASLLEGALATEEARRDKALVLRELDAAWQLSPALVAELRATFGADGSSTFADATVSGSKHAHRAEELRAGTADGAPLSLRDVVGTAVPGKGAWRGLRQGKHAWSSQGYAAGSDAASLARNRLTLRRVQVALQDRKPVLVDWYADDDRIDANGAFKLSGEDGPNAYWHASLIVDDEVATPTFGILQAGIPETRPAALAEAIGADAQIRFFRVKNPWWGSYPKDGELIPFAPKGPGYNDLDLDYLEDLLPSTPPYADTRRLGTLTLPPDTLVTATLPAGDAGADAGDVDAGDGSDADASSRPTPDEDAPAADDARPRDVRPPTSRAENQPIARAAARGCAAAGNGEAPSSLLLASGVVLGLALLRRRRPRATEEC